MRIKNLPKDACKELDLAFKASKHHIEKNRIQVIRLLSKKYSYKQVEDITGYSNETIQKFVTKYNKLGLEGLKIKTHISARNSSKLSIRQKDEIKRILDKHESPSKAGVKVEIEDDYWSVSTLKTLVKQRYNLEYKSDESYRRLLKYCDYTYQKVEFKDTRKPDEEQTKEFKKRATIKLKKGAMSMSW